MHPPMTATWAEVAPETVRVLREYLETDRYAVLTGQEHTEPLVQLVVDAFEAIEVSTADDRFRVELGDYGGIPAVLLTDKRTVVYFARADESKVVDTLAGEMWLFDDFVSLPESPPPGVVKVLGMFELRVWVPQSGRKTALMRAHRMFSDHRPVYLGDQDSVWVPAEAESDIFGRLDAYFERIAISMSDGGLSEAEARTVAFDQLSGDP